MSKNFEHENMEQVEEAAAVAAENAQEGAERAEGEITPVEENAAVEAAEGAQDGEDGAPVELVVKAREKKDAGAGGGKAKGTYTHTFRRPVAFEGKTYKALTFYWDKLTGADMISIENEMQDMNEYALSPEMSASFLAKMAAKAAGVGSDFIEALPVPDFTKIRNEARSFFNFYGLLSGPVSWYRKQSIRLARAGIAPVPFWLGMNPAQLTAWIHETNRAVKEEEEAMKKK